MSKLIADAVMQDGETRGRGLLDRLFALLFQSFVYNQIWEDPEVDLAALSLRPDDRVVTIASGGCNVLNYLVAGPESIIAVDLNPAHIALTRLKLAGVRHLPDHESFFRFFGLAKHSDNPELYARYLRPHLDDRTRQFWDHRVPLRGARIDYFAKGLYRRSLLGRSIGLAHFSARLLGADPRRMLAARTMAEQKSIFEATIAPAFEGRMVRALCGLPVTFYGLGIPPAQFEVLRRDCGGHLVDLFCERVRRLACDFPIADNYFAWQAFSRGYDCEHRQAVPSYLRPENFTKLRANADRVETRLASVTDRLQAEPDESCDAYVLLDAQDWMAPSQLNALWQQIGRTARPGAHVIFRTAGRASPLPEALAPALLAPWRYEEERSRTYLERDRSAIYGGFHLYRHVG